jgi:hypothetical protein
MTGTAFWLLPAGLLCLLSICVLSLLLYLMDKLQKILIAAAPIIARPPPLPQVPQVATQAGILQYLHDAGDSEWLLQLLQASDKPDSSPCPEIGGQHITKEWLMSLKDQDSLWCFQYEYMLLISSSGLHKNYRMTTQELIEMVDALEIPPKLITDSQYAFSGLEAFCLLYAHFHLAGDMYNVSMLYDHTESTISEVINDLVLYFDEAWEHLLNCDQDHLLHPSELA